ncbi:MAG: DNA polymerase III subunit alpha [Treponema sp.]|nr:DNA polymerase III subunit alpha [Treponema sp.]
MSAFVHLHVHSDFSLLDASASISGLVKKAQAMEMSHIALTDHGNMFGAMDFLAECAKNKEQGGTVKPIIGCEVYVSPGSRHDKKGSESENHYYHLVLLAKNREGYFNLARLCTSAYTEGFYHRPRVDDELLERHRDGLIALSACVSGEIPRLIRAGKIDEAEAKAARYRDLFGQDAPGEPNFFLEIQEHGVDAERLRGNLSQSDINRELVKISRKTGVPHVATNDAHYIEREDYEAHDVLLCIGTAKFRSEEKRKRYHGSEFYLKSAEEMAELFPDYPEAIANTVRIAERCVTDVPEIGTTELSGYLPESEIPENFDSADNYMCHLASEGLAERYAREKAEAGNAWNDRVARLDYELGVIIKMGFTGYFLIVADFIRWAREQGIPVGPGRGSGAGSVVAYALRITDIDPFKYDLLFERFLNPERISMPDFDIDFANYGRDDVIRYVNEKYGKDRVGQIITFGTLGAKAVIKDVARTLEISIDEADKIAKLIPTRAGITLEQAFKEEPRLREMEADNRYKDMFALARKLEGLNRQSGIHASGVVIGKTELSELLPLYRDSKTGAIATQYSMNFLERCGLVKMDFLGLKTLDVIARTEILIRERGGVYSSFSSDDIPEDDEATFKMLCEGNSFEIFQFESDGMRDILKRAKPGKIEDLIALNALYRPGPMDNIPQFIASKNGRQTIKYPDPSLEPILKETYGVITYQEQVMQVAQIIAGFSLGHADELRRAMGKKDMEKMIKGKKQFVEGAKARGYSEKKAEDIFDLLIPFAGYGFNKSHAAAYSVVAYRTAYLKANFPAEFMAANLSNEINSTDKDKLSECIEEARKMGIPIDPPDVNRSGKYFAIADRRIVYGLLGIKGIGEAPSDEIVQGRHEGPYKDFMDFLSKVDIKLVGKAVIERLVNTGAFDALGGKRETIIGNLERAVEFAQKQKEDKQFGQTSLFGDTDEKEYTDFVFEDFPELGKSERLKIEKQLIGFYFSGHPMDESKELWQKAVKANLGDPESLEMGSQILMGLIKSCKVVNSKSGKMAYATLADYNGEIEMIFFPKVWERLQERVSVDDIAIFKGKIDFQKDKERHSFVVDNIVNFIEVEEAIAAEGAAARKREKFRGAWLYMADLKSSMLAGAAKGSYTIVGQLSALRETQDRNGNDMAFGTLSDFEGDIDLLFFSKAWNEARDLLTVDEFVALKGNIDPASDRNPQNPSFKVSSVKDIVSLCRMAASKMAAGESPKTPAGNRDRRAPEESKSAGAQESASPAPAELNSIHIRLTSEAANTDDGISPLRNYLAGNPGPCPVFIYLEAPDGAEKKVRAACGLSVEAEKETLGVLEGCAGVAKAWKENANIF